MPSITKFIVQERVHSLMGDDELLEAEEDGLIARRQTFVGDSLKEKKLFHKLLLSLETPLDAIRLRRQTSLDPNDSPTKLRAFDTKKINLAIGSDSELSGI